MITVQHLGYFMGVEFSVHQAYVVWLSDPTKSIAEQMPVTFECEACQNQMDNTHLKNMTALQNPIVRQTSVSCHNCGAEYHYDITPEAERASLRWVHSFLKTS